MKNEIRQSFVTQALESYPELGRLINELTEKEVLQALNVESRTRRRQSIIDRLIARACRLNEINYQQQLKEKYHGSPRIEDPLGQERP